MQEQAGLTILVRKSFHSSQIHPDHMLDYGHGVIAIVFLNKKTKIHFVCAFPIDLNKIQPTRCASLLNAPAALFLGKATAIQNLHIGWLLCLENRSHH
jgi:hypothetical protein